MRITSPKFVIVTIGLVVVVLIATLYLTGNAQQHFDKKAIIKLYSGDKLVATWEATSVGQVEGNTYVFTTGTAPRPTQVRISGTYSVETVP